MDAYRSRLETRSATAGNVDAVRPVSAPRPPAVWGGTGVALLTATARAEQAAVAVTRVGLVTVLVWIGGLKAVPYEAEAIVPFAANSPFFRHFYAHPAPEYRRHANASGELVPANRAWHEENRTYAFAHGLGAVIVAYGVMIALHPWMPGLAALGSALVFAMSLVTLSLLLTTPECWVPPLGDRWHGFPLLATPGLLVVKGAVMAGAALVTMADSANARLRKAAAAERARFERQALVCVAPLTFSSTVAMFGSQGSGSFLLDATYTVIRSAGAIALVVFLIAKSGEAAALFGVRPFKPLADIGWGVGTFILGMVGYYLLWIWLSIVSGPATLSAMRQYDLSGLSAPSGPGGYALLVVMSLANGFAEEVVMRAYLIPRFEQLFGAAPLAVLLTSALFASYHTYQGPAGAISAAEIGLVYGAVFCVSRRLWPLAIAHAIQDIIGLAMLPK